MPRCTSDYWLISNDGKPLIHTDVSDRKEVTQAESRVNANLAQDIRLPNHYGQGMAVIISNDVMFARIAEIESE